MSFRAINCVANQGQIFAVFRNCSCQRCCSCSLFWNRVEILSSELLLVQFSEFIMLWKWNALLFPCMPPAPQARNSNHANYLLSLCSSQIMSPIPPVSSPPLTSKTKELADSENLDVSQTLYLGFDTFLVTCHWF